MLPYPHKQRTRARRLRTDQTEAEKKLCRGCARQLDGVKFRRQHPVGPFIADFCCVEDRLIIELDGGQHALRTDKDERRTMFLCRSGYRVLRFWDHDVLTDTDVVLERIHEKLIQPAHTFSPYDGNG
jgi:very-short-patch-repair endonuclease